MSRLKSLFIAAVAALSLAACGGGGSASDSDTVVIGATTASVGIIFADSSAVDAALAGVIPEEAMVAASSDAQLLITVTSVDLKGDSGDQTIFSGTEIIDLYELKDSLELFFVNESVIPGTFNKIRLQVASVSLCEPVPPESEADIETADCEDVKLPSNKIDFNPRGDFTIAAGDVVIVTLDVHANKSLKLTENPRKLILRPVVFVDIDSEPAFEEGLVRVSGNVDAIAADYSSFRLCSVAFVMPSEGIVATTALNEMCIDILATPPTGLFDDEGLPITVEELMVGDPVTVLGLLEMAPQATALAEGDSDSSPTPFRIVAVVVEGGVQGTWRKYAGEIVADEPPEEPIDPEVTPVAAAAVTEEGDTFSFQLASQEEPVTIRVYSTTRVFAVVPDGGSDPALNPLENLGLEEITPADLAVGDLAIIEAVRVVLPPPPEPVPPEEAPAEEVPAEELAEYRVALMLVLQDAVGAELLRGEIESVTPEAPVSPGDDPGNAGTLTVIADADGNSVCVNSAMETVIFRLIDNGDSVQAEKIALADLVVGDRIAIAGDSDGASGCFDAALMITRGPISL